MEGRLRVLDRAVDSSFDELTVQEAECFRDTGWPLYIQCLWTASVQPSPRVTSLRNADSVGLPFGTYISLNRFHDGAWHVDRARAGVPDDLWAKQLFTAIDIELDGIRVTEILRAIERAEELLVHPWQQVLLYTSYSSWTTQIVPRNSTAVSARGNLLWNAVWDLDPDIDFPRLSFGGWLPGQVALEQWSGGRKVCGQFVDRNTVVRELVFPPEGEDEVDEVAREQIQRLSQALGDTKRVVAELSEEVEGHQKTIVDMKRVSGEHYEETVSQGAHS